MVGTGGSHADFNGGTPTVMSAGDLTNSDYNFALAQKVWDSWGQEVGDWRSWDSNPDSGSDGGINTIGMNTDPNNVGQYHGRDTGGAKNYIGLLKWRDYRQNRVVYRMRYQTDSKTLYDVMIRVWKEPIDSWAGEDVAGHFTFNDYDMDYRVLVHAEFSWPATVPYDERQVAYFSKIIARVEQ